MKCLCLRNFLIMVQVCHVMHEAGEQGIGLRRGAKGGKEGIGVVAFFGEAFAFARDVVAHDAGVEFGMELYAPGMLAEAEGVVRVVRIGEEQGGFARQAQYALVMGGIGGKVCGQFGEERIVVAGSLALQGDVADFGAERVIADFSAESVGEELVAITNAKYG